MAKEFIIAIEPFFKHKAVSLVDVGAHRGETFALFSTSRLKINEAHLFEPNPQSFTLLRQKFQDHKKAHKFYFHNAALGRTAGCAVLEGLDDMTRVREVGQPAPAVQHQSHPKAIAVTTLDAEAKSFALPRISILKIDVEGAEIEILEGARGLLEQGKVDVIYVEAGLNSNCHTLTHYRRLEDFLLPLGFRIFRFFEQHHEWPDDSPLLRRANIAFMREDFARSHPYRLTHALDKAEQQLADQRRKLEKRLQQVNELEGTLASRNHTIRELEAALQSLREKLRATHSMLSFRLGKAIVDGSRSPTGILCIPYRLLVIYRDFKRWRRASGEHPVHRKDVPTTGPGWVRRIMKQLPHSAWLSQMRPWSQWPMRDYLPEEKIAAMAQDAHARGDWISSLILCDYLIDVSPRNSTYKLLRMQSEQAAASHFAKVPKINTGKTTARGRQLRLLHTLISLGYDKGKLLAAVKTLRAEQDRHALEANIHAGQDAAGWQKCISSLLAHYGLRGIALKPPAFGPSVMHNIAFEKAPAAPVDRGLISICIAAHNSAETLPYAIESLLRQDYQNFEIFVLNDASTDGTGEVAERFAKKDKRIVAIHNDSNRGTYWNRNLALARAKGIYFTTLDADDICHPQRIPLQLELLHHNPSAMGVFCLWFRLDPSGRLTYRNSWGGVIVHEAVATLAFRREPVTSRIGYYDPVRIAADTEYLERIKRVFGKASVPQIRKPLSIALAHPQSLTASLNTGIDIYAGLSQPRQTYRNAWRRWHESSRIEDLYLPYPNADYTRPFEAPPEITV
jgi:FkbM family methyltransferase